jgi:hypothetical protein
MRKSHNQGLRSRPFLIDLAALESHCGKFAMFVDELMDKNFPVFRTHTAELRTKGNFPIFPQFSGRKRKIFRYFYIFGFDYFCIIPYCCGPVPETEKKSATFPRFGKFPKSCRENQTCWSPKSVKKQKKKIVYSSRYSQLPPQPSLIANNNSVIDYFSPMLGKPDSIYGEISFCRRKMSPNIGIKFMRSP